MRMWLAGTVLLLTPIAVEAQSWVDLGQHPSAALQSTVAGRRISTLYGFNNKIYAGFGDYGANTGPIGIQPYHLDTFSYSPAPLLLSNTEAIYLFREIDGVLYAPHIDPKHGPSGSYSYATAIGSVDVWQDAPNLTAGDVVHAFDIAKFNGELYLAGTNGINAAIYRSADSGSTWTLAHEIVPNDPNYPNDFLRFYGLVAAGGKLITQHDAYYGPIPSESTIYDGTAWTSGSSIAPTGVSNILFTQPEVFGNQIIYRNYHPGVGTGLYSVGINNLKVDRISLPGTGSHYDFQIVGSEVWVLTMGAIYRSSNLNSWTLVTNVPSEARSLLYYQDELYVGTTDSRILGWGVEIPEPAGLALLGLAASALLRRRHRV